MINLACNIKNGFNLKFRTKPNWTWKIPYTVTRCYFYLPARLFENFLGYSKYIFFNLKAFNCLFRPKHGLRTPREEIAFTARPKIHSHSQIFRYGRSIFCLPHRPNISDIFDLCLHWVSIVRETVYPNSAHKNWHFFNRSSSWIVTKSNNWLQIVKLVMLH